MDVMDSTLNALHLIVNASVVVQIIMAILVVLSVLSWYAIFSKSAALRRAQAQSDGFEREFYPRKTSVICFKAH